MLLSIEYEEDVECAMAMKDFRHKTVYVVGGSSGIGLSIAHRMSSEGANIALFARAKEPLELALNQVATCKVSEEQKFYCRQIDVSSNDQVEAVMSEAMSEFGIPDVLINCAGKVCPCCFEDATYQQFDETMKVNLYGARNIISAVLPHMKKQGGHIVNVSSLAGLVGVFGYTDYCASKFALIGFSEVLRSELKRYGVMVSVLCPPDTDTPLFREEIKTKPDEAKAITARTKLMQPDEVTEVLINGIKKNRFLIIPGLEGKLVYIVKRLFPWLIEYMMDREIRRVQHRKWW